MGCDIHMWAEVKREGDEKWWAVGRVFQNSWHREGEPSLQCRFGAGDTYSTNDPLTDHPYDGRNYNLFGILANVRNGYGFAGVDTGDAFVPIAKPRGIPEDASDFYRWECDHGMGHTPSWLSLHELVECDWSRTTKHRGFVGVDQYGVFKAEGAPHSWSGMVSGGQIKHISNEQMDVVNTLPEGPRYFTQVEWEWTYAESCTEFVEKTIPALQEIADLKGVRDLRIVFFFDS